MAFFGVNFIPKKFCSCKKNDKYQVCLWGHSIQKNKLNCQVTSKTENLDIQHLSLVSYINLFEQGAPTTLVDLLNHLDNSFNPYLITSTLVPDRWIIPTEPLSASPPFEPQEPLLLPLVLIIMMSIVDVDCRCVVDYGCNDDVLTPLLPKLWQYQHQCQKKLQW